MQEDTVSTLSKQITFLNQEEALLMTLQVLPWEQVMSFLYSCFIGRDIYRVIPPVSFHFKRVIKYESCCLLKLCHKVKQIWMIIIRVITILVIMEIFSLFMFLLSIS